MKREINKSELFRMANSRASDIIRRDKTPVRFTIDPVTRGKVMIPKPRTITRSLPYGRRSGKCTPNIP